MEKIAITKTTAPKAKTPSSELGFGKVFSDHMFLMNYDAGEGWHSPRTARTSRLSIIMRTGSMPPA